MWQVLPYLGTCRDVFGTYLGVSRVFTRYTVYIGTLVFAGYVPGTYLDTYLVFAKYVSSMYLFTYLELAGCIPGTFCNLTGLFIEFFMVY